MRENNTIRKNAGNKTVLGLNTRTKNFMLLKHYNTIALTESDKDKIIQAHSESDVFMHDFKLSEIVAVFEPFLNWARDRLKGISDDEIEKMLDKCKVYSLHKSLFRSYFKTGKAVRDEMLLIDEVAFEQEKIASAVVRIVSYAARDRHIVFLLNDLQYAAGSTYHFIHNLIEDRECSNISIIATYNEAKVPMAHVEDLWAKFYEYLCLNNYVIETNQGTLNKQKSTMNDLAFSPEYMDEYILKINNLLFCLDFSQANHYLEIIYKMITVEELDITWEHKCEIIRLYTRTAIYTQDFSQALLLGERLNDLRWESSDLSLDFSYYYFMCMAHMYNGKLEEAAAYSQKCYEVAFGLGSDYDIFISKLLTVMVKMSGWHNIFFCASDIPIEDELIKMAEKYNYWNHLAHIYVYAYDNHPSLFEDDTQVENRLVYFNKGIAIMKDLGNEYFMMEAYRNNIMIASTNGFFKTAMYYYDKCHELVRGKDEYEEAMIYNGVGYISSAMEDYDKAFSCYNQALTSFIHMEKIDYVGETLYNMAINCIMAQDYKDAYDYLEMAFRIVKETKMNSLRVCNISKLAGLLALCSYYNGNELKCAVYTEKTRLFLEHLIDREDVDNEHLIVHDYTMCKDDLFIYYYVCGLQLVAKKEYEAALKNFEQAANCIDDSVGNQFYIFKQYISEFASLYRIMGYEDKAVLRLKGAIEFYEKQDCANKVKELKAELEHKPYKAEKHKLYLSQKLRKKIDETLRHAAVYKENQEQQKRMGFLSAWQKLVEIGDKCKHELVTSAVNAFMHNFNIDRLVLVKYNDNQPEVLFNNTGYEFSGKRRSQIEAFFHRNRMGFVTSKINNNYVDYLDIVSLFEKNKVCSIIGLPFYFNDALKATLIAYISMKDNWHSPSTRYLLDESDYAVVEFVIRQLLTSIDMLEANDKIKNMNDKLNRLAVTDKLTGLYNREGFYDNLSKLVRRNKDKIKMQAFTIMYVDLDNFKYYNDTFGHGVGDVILKEMAKIFRTEVVDTGFVTRYGGDEFLITVYTDDRGYIEKLAGNIYSRIGASDGFTSVIREKIGKEIVISTEHRLSCSIGISSINNLESEEQLENVIKEADKVLYDVKKSGKGAYKFYGNYAMQS